jgi:hypothetical protein
VQTIPVTEQKKIKYQDQLKNPGGGRIFVFERVASVMAIGNGLRPAHSMAQSMPIDQVA